MMMQKLQCYFCLFVFLLIKINIQSQVKGKSTCVQIGIKTEFSAPKCSGIHVKIGPISWMLSFVEWLPRYNTWLTIKGVNKKTSYSIKGKEKKKHNNRRNNSRSSIQLLNKTLCPTFDPPDRLFCRTVHSQMNRNRSRPHLKFTIASMLSKIYKSPRGVPFQNILSALFLKHSWVWQSLTHFRIDKATGRFL